MSEIDAKKTAIVELKAQNYNKLTWPDPKSPTPNPGTGGFFWGFPENVRSFSHRDARLCSHGQSLSSGDKAAGKKSFQRNAVARNLIHSGIQSVEMQV